MCKKGYKQTEEHRKNISNGQFGNKRSEKTRKLQSDLKQGCVPWNKGKHNIYSKETINKMSESAKIKIFSEEHKKNISKSLLGNKRALNKHWSLSEETKLKMSDAQVGEKHPNYIDGRSYLPYSAEFNKLIKQRVRKIDNYQCQMPECLINQLENLSLYHQLLHVHHIDYNKFNCGEHNLIALCTKHNIKANKNRNYWKQLYMNIVKKREII